MSKLSSVSSSPHVRSHEIAHNIMLGVVIAMSPASVFGAYHFGLHALLILIVTVVARMLNEYVYEKLMHRPCTLSDCSVLVAGIAPVLNMPPGILVWVPVLGGIFATIVVKQLYGGLGQNFTNPALTARYFPLIFLAGKMTDFSYSGLDGTSGATPLIVLESDGKVDIPTMFVGNISGTTDEASVIALLVGAAYLLFRKAISIRIPGTYILTAIVLAVLSGGHGFNVNYILAHLCGGELIFDTFSMATDYVTGPVMPKGRIVSGILLDALTGLFRTLNGFVEGMSYVVIISNILVPLIEKVTPPKAFGKGGK